MSKEIVEAILAKDVGQIDELVNEELMGGIAIKLDEVRQEISKNLFNEGKMKEEDEESEEDEMSEEGDMDDEMSEEDDKEDVKESSDTVVSDDGQSEVQTGGTVKGKEPKGKPSKGKKIKTDSGDEVTA